MQQYLKATTASIAIALLSLITVQSHAGAPLSTLSKDSRAVAIEKSEQAKRDTAEPQRKREYKEKTEKRMQRSQLVKPVVNAYIAEFDKHVKIRNAELKAYAVATRTEQVQIEEKRVVRETQIAERIARKILSGEATSNTAVVQLDKERIEAVRLIGELYIAEFYSNEAKRPEKLRRYAAAAPMQKEFMNLEPAETKEELIEKIVDRSYPAYYGNRERFCKATLSAYNAAPLFEKIQLEKKDVALAYCRFNESDTIDRAVVVERYVRLELREAEKEKYDAQNPAATAAEKMVFDKKYIEKEYKGYLGHHARVLQRTHPEYCKGDEICIAEQKTYAAATLQQQIQIEKKRFALAWSAKKS